MENIIELKVKDPTEIDAVLEQVYSFEKDDKESETDLQASNIPKIDFFNGKTLKKLRILVYFD